MIQKSEICHNLLFVGISVFLRMTPTTWKLVKRAGYIMQFV